MSGCSITIEIIVHLLFIIEYKKNDSFTGDEVLDKKKAERLITEDWAGRSF